MSAGCQTAGGDSSAAAAKLNLKLDESAKPLPADSTIRVRYRSSFGLKYLEVQRGEGDPLPEGGSLPLGQATDQVEFDDIGNTFDTPTREAARTNLQEFGAAFAGRGASLNQAIESFNPLRPTAMQWGDWPHYLEPIDGDRVVACDAVHDANPTALFALLKLLTR